MSSVSNYDEFVSRKHTWSKAIYISFSLSLCITVDILQYSMPLAFLPSVLEDRGHSPMKIATAIGVYYWTGFLGGCCITGYQICRVVSGEGSKSEEDESITMADARKKVYYLVFGLALGGGTLACQAFSPRYNVHLSCRFVQGFAGAFLFFYTFLLSAQLFSDKTRDGRISQRTFAMTAASAALNVAEVLGSMFGAVIFHHWGQRMVFIVLAVASFINIVMLLCIIPLFQPVMEDEDASTSGDDSIRGEEPEVVPESKKTAASPNLPLRRLHSGESDDPSLGWARLRSMVAGRHLNAAVLLIATAAVVKGSVEEMLPFHADHRWHMQPLAIGTLFTIVALSYIVAAIVTGYLWEAMSWSRIPFASFWLGVLGIVAYSTFSVASWEDPDVAHFYALLGLYGVCLGCTHTPAALMLGDAIEHEKGPGKDAANGVWNTMWEAGGSLGFLLGGLLAHNYAGQLELLTMYSVMCVIAGAAMLGFFHDLYSGSLVGRDHAQSVANLKLALKKREKDYGAMKN